MSTADDSQVTSHPAPTLHGCVVTMSRGQQVIHVARSEYLSVMRALLADGYAMCVDLTAVDYLLEPRRDLPVEVKGERFEIVLNLLSFEHRSRLRVRIQIPSDDASLATAFDLWPGTEAMEREVFDMFGITFDGHPDLNRILMPEDWDGHPLRKDYAVGRIPVQFSGDHRGGGAQ